MIMKIAGVEEDIYFDDTKDTLLLFEDSKIYGKMMFLLNSIISGVNTTNEIVFLNDDGKSIIKDCIIVSDLLNIEVNTKKLLTSLYKRIALSLDLQDEIRYKYIALLNEINLIVDEELDNYNVEFSYIDELSIESYLKSINLHVKMDQLTNPFDVISNYFEIMSELVPNQVFIFVNTLNYYSSDEVKELLKIKKYKHLNVLFIERYCDLKPNFDTYIIDEDYDLFHN